MRRTFARSRWLGIRLLRRVHRLFSRTYQLDLTAVCDALKRQASAIGHTFPELLERLRLDVPGFVDMLETPLANQDFEGNE